jgi:AmmeMemoRadiSam system protein B
LVDLDPALRPRLRPVEARAVKGEDGEVAVQVHDPTQHALGSFTLSPPAFFLLTQMDGQHTLTEIGAAFASQFGQPLPAEKLTSIISQLSQARLLEDEVFAEYYQRLVDDYRQAPTRTMRSGPHFEPDAQSELGYQLDQLLGGGQVHDCSGPARGLIVPHLDFPRGAPCYADGYRTLAEHCPAQRFIVLGTNHFGQALAVSATGKDYATPLGTLPNDRDFLNRIQTQLGCDLCEHELDHAREHSIELQVLMLQRLFADRDIRFVPFLCTSPCGPGSVQPTDNDGLNLKSFAAALRQCMQEDDMPTCIIAGADLSHVGRFFGDEQDLEQPWLEQVAEGDRKFLAHVLTGNAEALADHVTSTGNPTRFCSVGCIYTLLMALPESKPSLLRYHQAVVKDWENCVTCATLTFC